MLIMEQSPEDNPFTPNSVIELKDATQLHRFENILVGYIAPRMTPVTKYAWEGRTKLSDALRPLRFNGTISDIQLQVMNNAAERMESTRERGFSFAHGGQGTKATQERIAFYEEYGEALGLTYIAHAKSSGRGIVGQVQAEIWYQPAVERNIGLPIHRTVTKPKYERENFQLLEEGSQRIALDSLQRAISCVRPNGFHN